MLAVTALLLPGCLQMRVAVVVRADGSGSQTLHLGMSKRVVDSVRASAQALDASGQRGDPLQVFDADKVGAELRELGLTVTEHRSYQEGSRQLVDIAASFGDFATLGRSSLLGGDGEWFALAGRNAGNVRLVFYPRGHAAWLTAKQQAEQLRSQPSAVQEQFFATQRQRVEGLDIEFALSVPGDIDYASSNLAADADDARTVKARVQAEDIGSAAELVVALAPRYEVEFAVGEDFTIPLVEADPGLVALAKARAEGKLGAPAPAPDDRSDR